MLHGKKTKKVQNIVLNFIYQKSYLLIIHERWRDFSKYTMNSVHSEAVMVTNEITATFKWRTSKPNIA